MAPVDIWQNSSSLQLRPEGGRTWGLGLGDLTVGVGDRKEIEGGRLSPEVTPMSVGMGRGVGGVRRSGWVE